MPAVVPTRVATVTARWAAVSFAAQLSVLVVWILGWLPDRHDLGVMLSMPLACSSVVLGTAAVLARCHLATAEAFTAGVQAGRATSHRNGLRAVD